MFYTGEIDIIDGWVVCMYIWRTLIRQARRRSAGIRLLRRVFGATMFCLARTGSQGKQREKLR